MRQQTLREKADRVRGVPLEEVLLVTGARRDPSDRTRWHTVQGAISVTGMKFMNWHHGGGGGGAIDLAIHLNRLDFRTAVRWLWHHFPNPGPSEQAGPPPVSSLKLPPPNAVGLLRVKHYLVHDRRLDLERIERLIASDTLYADSRCNAVFLMLGKENRPVGAELRGTTSTPWRGMAPGSKKDLGYFSTQPPLNTIVLCESAIDAISCAMLQPDRLCISTAGARPNPRWLPSLVTQGYDVYCGFDADPPGEHMAQTMIALYPSVKRLRPPRHDWNDVLTS